MLELSDECVAAAHGRLPPAADGKKRVSIPVMKNAFIERYFARAHWVTPILWFGPVIAFGWHRGLTRGPGFLGTFALFLAGWLVWTLSEYLLHRFVFHFVPHGPDEEVRAFLMHGYHHDFPDDAMRLVMPLALSIGPAIAYAVLYYFTVGEALWPITLAGTAAGYVAYDWIHYYTHHGRPRGGVGKWLRRYHMVHHFGDGSTRFGVSSPLWDMVFGTFRSFSGSGASSVSHAGAQAAPTAK